MPLLAKTWTIPYSEREMQDGIVKFLGDYDRFMSGGNFVKDKDIYQEIHNPDVGRISDILIHLNFRTWINIECKLTGIVSAIKQAKDHLAWVDYSYIAMPHNAYVGNEHIGHILELGIGMLLWDNENKILIESIHASYNRKKNKLFKKRMMAAMEKFRQLHAQMKLYTDE